MVNRFVLNETFLSRSGSHSEHSGEIKGRGFKKAFVCSDPDLIKFNVTKKVTDILENAGIDYEIYSEIKANPSVANVKTGVEAFKCFWCRLYRCDWRRFFHGYSKSHRYYHYESGIWRCD